MAAPTSRDDFFSRVPLAVEAMFGGIAPTAPPVADTSLEREMPWVDAHVDPRTGTIRFRQDLMGRLDLFFRGALSHGTEVELAWLSQVAADIAVVLKMYTRARMLESADGLLTPAFREYSARPDAHTVVHGLESLVEQRLLGDFLRMLEVDQIDWRIRGVRPAEPLFVAQGAAVEGVLTAIAAIAGSTVEDEIRGAVIAGGGPMAIWLRLGSLVTGAARDGMSFRRTADVLIGVRQIEAPLTAVRDQWLRGVPVRGGVQGGRTAGGMITSSLGVEATEQSGGRPIRHVRRDQGDLQI